MYPTSHFCVLPAIIVKPIVSTFVKLLTTYSKLVSFHIFYEHRDDKEKKSQELTSYELLI